MLVKTGLLIVSNPSQIGKSLQFAEKYVKKTLYIQLLPALNISLSNVNQNLHKTWPKHSQAVYKVYSQAANFCQNIDVRVLLSHLKYNTPIIKTFTPIEVVIFDQFYEQKELDTFIKARLSNHKNYEVVVFDNSASGSTSKTDDTIATCSDSVADHTVLGGTFDRLHLAHKLLLSEAALRSKTKITIGITEGNMLQSKKLWELIEDINVRKQKVSEFLNDICPELEVNVVSIYDPFGPAVVDPTMEIIVVSAETIRGGEKINEIRESKGLCRLEIVPIELIDEPNPLTIEEKKVSSSNRRIRLLGSLLNPVIPNEKIPSKPYIIGLTGGIASGKSNVAKRLLELGSLVIDCDKIAHQVYLPGKPCYEKLVDHFGPSVVAENGEINRQVLGSIVFKNPGELNTLNSIVWPFMAQEIKEIIKKSNKEIVIVEAAVLLQAEWDKLCHEVWSTFIPKEEAVNRLINRNGLTKEQALSRIDSQPANTTYVNASNVVFYTFWDYEYTEQQVNRAWKLLNSRLLNPESQSVCC